MSIVVAAGADLDYEKMRRLDLLVSSVDGAGHVASLPLAVRLIDQNDNAPAFHLVH